MRAPDVKSAGDPGWIRWRPSIDSPWQLAWMVAPYVPGEPGVMLVQLLTEAAGLVHAQGKTRAVFHAIGQDGTILRLGGPRKVQVRWKHPPYVAPVERLVSDRGLS